MGWLQKLNAANFTVIHLCILFMCTSRGLPTDKEHVGSKSGVCSSTECQQKAKFIQSMLNESIDPCNNFYDYVCQRWMERNPIREDSTRYGMFTMLREKLEKELKDILENKSVTEDKRHITDKIRGAYQLCLAECLGGSKLQALKEIMESVGIQQWPVLTSNKEIPEWTTTYANMATRLGIKPIFDMGVHQDPKNATNYVLQFDQLTFGVVGRNQFLNQSNNHNAMVVRAYKEFIKGVTKLVATEHMGEVQLEDFAEEMVDFEVQLANRSKPEELRRDYQSMYKNKTVKELQKELPQVEWKQFLNLMFKNVNIEIAEEEPVGVWEMEYYNSTLKFLDTVNRSTIHNYFGWKAISELGFYLGDNFTDLSLKLEEVTVGVKKNKAKWEQCVSDLQYYTGHPLGRLYVDKMFSEHAKEEVVTMVMALKQTFRKIVEGKQWMDNETKVHALEKVNSIQWRIGYPDWLKNDTHLDELYEYVKDFNKTTPYMTVIASLMENNAKKSLKRLREAYNKSSQWVTSAAKVNAYYNPGSNDITFPAAILQPPFYEYGLPLSLNMGAIGMVIGHEIVHAFDDTGSQFDAEGNLHDWWTNSTKQEFRTRADCFVKQYSSIKDSATCMQLNGENTVGENIADNGGLLGAFRAYNALVENKTEHLYLPGLNKTSEQMFFIANAIVWCKNMREERLRQMIQYDTHSPTKYRVTVPMGNMLEFSAAFDCKAGTPMNRTDKCEVW